MLTVRDVMTTRMLTFGPEMSLRDAIEQLAAQRVTGAPVLANHRVVGTLSANDVLGFVASTPGVPTQQPEGDPWFEGLAEPWGDGDAPPATYFTDFWDDAGADITDRFEAVHGPEWDMLDEHTVAEAMSTNVFVLPPTASLRVAADYMERSGVHRVLIVERGHLLGIVTTMDVTKAFARMSGDA